MAGGFSQIKSTAFVILSEAKDPYNRLPFRNGFRFSAFDGWPQLMIERWMLIEPRLDFCDAPLLTNLQPAPNRSKVAKIRIHCANQGDLLCSSLAFERLLAVYGVAYVVESLELQ